MANPVSRVRSLQPTWHGVRANAHKLSMTSTSTTWQLRPPAPRPQKEKSKEEKKKFPGNKLSLLFRYNVTVAVVIML